MDFGDRYRVVRELGRGGMGVVYLGRDLRRDMDVAIKRHERAPRWLKREFRAVAPLRHPNLVEHYELVGSGDACFVTMEYLPGVDPRRYCAGVDYDRVRAVLAQLAEGLAFLHARGVIHRDIKPSNALVVDGVVKLLDFGLALRNAPSAENRMVGTVAYLAPEYVDRLLASPAMDLYALGVLGFELVTGSVPFGGAMQLARVKGAMPRTRTIARNTPADLDELIASLLVADPAARPTARDVLAELTGSRPQELPRRGRFVGRKTEHDRLVERVDDPTPRTRLVVVTGPSGAGKTALIDRVRATWRSSCHERERVPYRAFDAIVDDLADELAVAPEVVETIEHAAALATVFPALGLRHAPPAGDLRVERERAHHALVELFRRLVDRFAATPPGVLAIDDLQWADEDSLELIALLVERVDRPLTIVATWTDRPGALAELVARTGAEVIALDPLPDDEVDEMLAELAPGADAVRLADAIRHAGGSPYLAELLGRDLDVADARDAEMRRLARLGWEARAVAELVAIAPGATTFEQLQALAELPPARLASALRALEHERVIRASPSPAGDAVYVFNHQPLRDATVAALGARERALHRKFAELLERTEPAPERLAFHWERAGESAHAARWALVAGDAARAQLAWSLAAEHYANAGAWLQRAEVLFLGGKLAEAASEFLAVGGDRFVVRAAEAYIKLGEIDRGLALLDPVLARHGQPRAKTRVRSALNAARVVAGWLVPARPPERVVAQANRVLASFLSTPYPVEALEYVLRDTRDAARRDDRDGHSIGMAMLATYVAAASLGRFGDAFLARARRIGGSRYAGMVTAGCAGVVAMLRGDWVAMRRAHEIGAQACAELGLERTWEASFLRGYWALGELYAGEPRRAIALLDDLASDDLISRDLFGSFRGRALLVAGDREGARAIWRRLGTYRGMAGVYRDALAGELALADHDWDRAAQIAGALARDARAQWLSALPAVTALVDVIDATAAIGRGDRARATEVATHLLRRGRASFYAVTARRLLAQADPARAGALLAAAAASPRGGRVDRLAIAALRGHAIDPGPLAAAVTWSTGGIVRAS